MHKAVAFRAILVTNHLREKKHMLLLSHRHTQTHMQYIKPDIEKQVQNFFNCVTVITLSPISIYYFP